jgi:nicotinate phosphoribosyltransferase
MAHSFVMVFNHEVDAFTAFSEQFKKNSIFLIDTYDTIKGAKAAAEVAIRMKEKGNSLIGVRLDSGDFVKLSKQVRKILKSTGLNEVKLFATGNFDENKIKKVLSKGAEIDAFGVGTRMGVSADAPYLDIVYKMVRFHDRNVRKLSPHKKTLAGEKQIFRIKDRGGYFKEDILGLRIEKFKGTTKLLEKVMEDGKLIVSHPSLNSLQRHFKEELSHLPSNYRSFSTHAPFPVKISPALLRLQKIRPLEKR